MSAHVQTSMPGFALWWWLALACGGLAVTLAAVLAGRLFIVRDPEDRQYRDRPPLLWRVFWPVVQPASVRLAPLLSAATRGRLAERLQRAGLDFALTPEQFVAGRAVAAVCGMLAIGLASHSAGFAAAPSLLFAGAIGFLLPASWLRDCIENRARSILKQLPFFLDVITLAVEAGMNLSGALEQAVEKGPRGALRAELERTLRDLRAGRAREDALRALAARLSLPAIGALVGALLVTEKQGGALGPVLRAQAEQRRNERFLRAEKLAMEAPVKMLPPLLVFIFPCTFVILLFPVASRFIEEGWLR